MIKTRTLPPAALTIAGSDSSGGAGIQADLKTFAACGVYGATAITCAVAEHAGRVASIAPLPPERVAEQAQLAAEGLPLRAVKTGMLYSRAIIEAVAGTLEIYLSSKPLVVDPVMVSSSGTALLEPDAVAALEAAILPRAALVTPNRKEAERLLGTEIADADALREAAERLAEKYGVPFLVKGGHFQGEEAVDVLCAGGEITLFSQPRVPGRDPHGTGCTLSAAIAAQLALGMELKEAVAEAKRYVTRAIAGGFRHGGHDLLDHFA
ncbi:MAG: bifunctional hydroxymethylpyrimidine kinase/phosphomethylpyrimidine kinase [Verrucomicrobium sp.]|nr:bifunctional hydroxymethylpyrimidine kinase/phosphomethylpyrimidine kinase [Verrucomicrobium sp.]